MCSRVTTLTDRHAHLRRSGGRRHYLPHDAASPTTIGGDLRQSSARCLAVLRVVPCIDGHLAGIRSCRRALRANGILLPNRKEGVEHPSRYSRRHGTSTGIARDEPVHDRHSHQDAPRQLAQATTALVPGGQSVGAVLSSNARPGLAVVRSRSRI